MQTYISKANSNDAVWIRTFPPDRSPHRTFTLVRQKYAKDINVRFGLGIEIANCLDILVLVARGVKIHPLVNVQNQCPIHQCNQHNPKHTKYIQLERPSTVHRWKSAFVKCNNYDRSSGNMNFDPKNHMHKKHPRQLFNWSWQLLAKL